MNPRNRRMRRFLQISSASLRRWGHAKGKKINDANVQRRQASDTGGITPTIARPRTILPPQNAAVSVNSSRGRLKNDLKGLSFLAFSSRNLPAGFHLPPQLYAMPAFRVSQAPGNEVANEPLFARGTLIEVVNERCIRGVQGASFAAGSTV